VAVATLALGVLAELADGLNPSELVVGHGRGVGVAGDDLAVVDDVSRIHRAGEDLLEMLPVPGAAESLAGHVRTAGRLDSLARELLGEALPAVAAVEVLGEHPFDRLEVGHRVVRDHKPPGFEGVAERGVSVLPMSLFCLGVHPALHVAGQLLRVPLRQPREDRPDQLAEGLVAGVRLSQRDHVHVGLVERCEGLEAVHHVPGDAGEGPDIQAIHALDAHLAASKRGIALGLGGTEQGLVRDALLGRAPTDPLVDEPQVVGNGHAISGSATGDFLSLLLDALVLARVRTAKVSGADDGHR